MLKFLNFKDKKKIIKVTIKSNYLKPKKNQLNIELLIGNIEIKRKNSNI